MRHHYYPCLFPQDGEVMDTEASTEQVSDTAEGRGSMVHGHHVDTIFALRPTTGGRFHISLDKGVKSQGSLREGRRNSQKGSL